MKIILTRATGYVGEGTLIELLKVDEVEKVLSVSRKPTGLTHEKLEEYIVPDFMKLQSGDEHFNGYDAVFFIAGVTSIGTPKGLCVHFTGDSAPLCRCYARQRTNDVYLPQRCRYQPRREAVLAESEG